MKFRVVLLCCSLSALVPPLRADDKLSFTGNVAPILNRYCAGCHSPEKKRGNLILNAFQDDAAALKEQKIWEKVLQALQTGEMPPAGKPRPTQAERDLLVRWINNDVFTVDCKGDRDPGRVTIRRLNRAEYNNTIRDLVGVDFQPAEDFPLDDVGYGFDNIGDVLSLSPVLFEKYMRAARKIATDAIVTDGSKKTEPHKRIIFCEPSDKLTKDECARKIVEEFATRAYRRPATPDEVERLAKLVKLAQDQGESFEKGVQLAVQAVLVSPHFLFRIERDRTARPPMLPKTSYPIGEYELATRLSYFLWSSMPDDELFARAKAEDLRKPDVLAAQVRRMLKDPKAKALVTNFAGQWLQFRDLATYSPDKGTFPSWDRALRDAMIGETERFVEEIIREDRSVLEFIDADFTYVNERLARHYGIDGVKGSDFQRVKLTDGVRGGVLTQASVLTITSNPTRTSPVKRGKWVLENILGTPPPPPPPDVPELPEKKSALTGSLRQRMEKHRENPTCASCHARMDPIGFGFENFDGIGAWREMDGKFPIDPSGTLPSGQSFKGPGELKKILLAQKDLVAHNLSERMLTYALGRGLEYYDRCAVDEISAALAKDRYKFSTLVLEIVKSDPFQKRRGKR